MRKRIDLTRYEKAPEENVSGGMITGPLQELVSDSLELKSVLNLLTMDATVYWVSDGNWSMHQLLIGILNMVGAAHVTISSYAMSETPARILSQLKDLGKIITLRCVLDNRVDVRSAGSLQLIKSISNDFSLVDTHAKVTLIKNDDWSISVVGSANYTENKRYEAGIVTTSTNAYDMNDRWITKALRDGIKQ
jgi:hypothetical protein